MKENFSCKLNEKYSCHINRKHRLEIILSRNRGQKILINTRKDRRMCRSLSQQGLYRLGEQLIYDGGCKRAGVKEWSDNKSASL